MMKNRLKIVFPTVIFLISIISIQNVGGNMSTTSTAASSDEIKLFFKNQGKEVLTFLGYSGLGYEDENAMRAAAIAILEKYTPHQTIVNIGATEDGIGAVYQLARQRGFTTTGIVSSLAKTNNVRLAPDVMYVFYVEDDSWGGRTEDGKSLSPTSKAMVENSDILVAIGGGAIARDELQEARRLDKEVHFIPADMNHDTATQKAQRKGEAPPDNFKGEAHSLFQP